MDLAHKLEELEAYVRDLESQNEQLQAEKARIEDRNEHLLQGRKILNDKINRKQEELDAATTSIKALFAEVESLRKRLKKVDRLELEAARIRWLEENRKRLRRN